MITRNRILFILGIFIVLQPFLGFPSPYESFSITILGLAVIVLASMYARDKRMNSGYNSHSDHAVEDLSRDAYTQSYPTSASRVESRENEPEEEERYTNLGEIRSRARTTKTF